MQNITDENDKTKEVPVFSSSAKQEKNTNPDVHEDQQSMFDEGEIFSESMLVEKDELQIDSSTEIIEDVASTTIFDIPERDESVSVKDLQDTAKSYYDATHSESIEDKVNELCRLADEGFYDEYTLSDELDVEKEEIVVDDEKKKKKEKKLRRRGFISNDDMEMLADTAAISAVSHAEYEPIVPTEEFEDQLNEENEAFEEEEAYAVSETETFSGDGQWHDNPLGDLDDEEDDEDGDVTEEDKMLIKALGGNKKHIITFESVFGDDEPDVEYTDRNQEPTILKDLRKNAILSAFSVLLTLIASVVCFYFEIAAGTQMPHPAIFEAGKFGVAYSMSMLQIMFLCVIFNLEGMKRAFKGLRPKKASAEGFAAVSVIVCTLHSVLSAILMSDNPGLKSFCSAGCLSLFVLSVNTFIKSQTTLASFCIAASKSLKISSSPLDNQSQEAAPFEKYIDKDTTLFAVEKHDFVSGFFKKCIAVPKASKNTVKVILWVFVASLVTAVACSIMKDVYSGICAFATVCLAAFPVNALISTALPFFAASSKAKKTQTAFIGEAACDAYETTAAVYFDDTEVFPQKSVKVSSIRTYSDNRIDKVILYMARIFDKVEGPLSYVFANSVQTLESHDADVRICECFADGISAKIDSKEVLVGTENFMKLYDFETPLDNIDESFTRSLGSIMYMAVDGVLAAKFYIKYTMSRTFEPVLRSFYDAGICVGIRTADPCITNEILCGNLKGSNYPVSVIRKNMDKSAENAEKSQTEGAVICLSGVHNFLKGFIRLDNLRNVYRSNTIISVFAAVTGILAAAALNVTGIMEVSVMLITMFQLVWCIPTVLFSLLSK